MKNKTFIQFKAAFLLIIFSLNMIISFACTMNIFCYKCSHESTDLTSVKCSHHKSSEAGHKEGRCADNCCNDVVVKFSGIDKSFPQCYTGILASAFVSLISPFYHTDILQNYCSFANDRHPGRNYHPPIPDIRIAIQSFQI